MGKYKKLYICFILSSCIGFAIFYPKLPAIFFNQAKNADFVVKDIYLSELKFLPVKAVIDSLDFSRGDNIFEIDLDENKKSLEEIFWIEKALIKIKFPNIIDVRIKEKIPEFIIKRDDKYFYVDSSSAILKEHDENNKYADLIILKGKGIINQIPNILEFIKLDKELYSYISEIIWVSNRRLDILFYNGMKVQLPELNVALAWKNFIAYEKEIGFFNRKVKIVDMRIEDRLFLELDMKNKENRKILRGL